MKKIYWTIALFSLLILYSSAQPWLNRQAVIANNTLRLTAQQFDLLQYKQTNDFINNELSQVLTSVPGAARVRLAYIRPPASQTALASSLRFDVVYSLASVGHAAGTLTEDRPVTEWNDFFSKLMNHQCALLKVEKMTNPAPVARLTTLKVAQFMVCPIFNSNQQLLGAITILWDIGDPLPVDMSLIERRLRKAAVDIGTRTPLGV